MLYMKPKIPYLDFGHITRKIYWVKNPLSQSTLLGCVAIFIYTLLRLTTIDDLLSTISTLIGEKPTCSKYPA